MAIIVCFDSPLDQLFCRSPSSLLDRPAETAVVPDSDISIQQQQGSLQFVEGADLMEVVDALNALGATPQELMSILEALKASGALRAELEII